MQNRTASVEGIATANANAITNLLDCLYVNSSKGVYKYLLTGWNSSSFYVYVNSTNYTTQSSGYRTYFSTNAGQLWFERASGSGSKPLYIKAYHYGDTYSTESSRGRFLVKVYASSTSYHDYWTTTDDTSTVAGILPTTFTESAMSFVETDSKITLQQWCLEMFQTK